METVTANGYSCKQLSDCPQCRPMLYLHVPTDTARSGP